LSEDLVGSTLHFHSPFLVFQVHFLIFHPSQDLLVGSADRLLLVFQDGLQLLEEVPFFLLDFHFEDTDEPFETNDQALSNVVFLGELGEVQEPGGGLVRAGKV